MGVLVSTVFCIVCTVLFMYRFSYWFCLYCHQVTTQLQLVSGGGGGGSSSNCKALKKYNLNIHNQ
jgi:hypothetical protein